MKQLLKISSPAVLFFGLSCSDGLTVGEQVTDRKRFHWRNMGFQKIFLILYFQTISKIRLTFKVFSQPIEARECFTNTVVTDSIFQSSNTGCVTEKVVELPGGGSATNRAIPSGFLNGRYLCFSILKIPRNTEQHCTLMYLPKTGKGRIYKRALPQGANSSRCQHYMEV